MSNAIYQNTYELSFFPFAFSLFFIIFYCVVYQWSSSSSLSLSSAASAASSHCWYCIVKGERGADGQRGVAGPVGERGSSGQLGVKVSSPIKRVKVAHTPLPSVWFRSWSRFLAVSLHVTCVINPAVGCHYFPPGPQLPSQPLRGLLPVSLLGEQRHDGCEQSARLLPDSVATAIWTHALLRLSSAR